MTRNFKQNRRLALASIGVIAMNTVAGRAWAQAPSWPQRPLKMVVSLPAGSGVDAIARLLGDWFAKSLGQGVVIDNKPGGQNVIGAQSVARSAPDGYTIYLATAAALVTNAYLFKQMTYDPRKDFAPIGFVGLSPFAIFVSPTSPYATLQDLLTRAKAAPGKISLGNEGPKSFGGITARLLNAKSGAEFNLIPYASGNIGIQELIGGQIDAFVGDVASAAQLTKQGKLRMLAMTSLKRVQGWDVPTVSESIPGFDMVGWIAMVAPAGTPQPILARLNRELDAAMSDKGIQEKIHAIGPDTKSFGPPENLAAFLADEHKRWAEISREIGLLPE